MSQPPQITLDDIEEVVGVDDVDEPLAPTVDDVEAVISAADVEPSTEPSRINDLEVDFLRGLVGAGQGFVGLADLVTRGSATPTLKHLGIDLSAADRALQSGYSQRRQQASRQVAEAEGVKATTLAALRNPSVIAGTVVQSAPSMAAGSTAARLGLAGLSRLAPGLAARLVPLAGGIGEAAITAGQQAQQVTDETGGLTGGQAALAAGSGALTGAIGAVSAPLVNLVAKRIGMRVVDVDALLAGSTDQVRGGLARAAVLAAIQEGLLEELPQSVQEQVATNLALGRDPLDGIDESAVLGAMSGGVMGAGAQLVASRGPALPPPAPPPPATAAPVDATAAPPPVVEPDVPVGPAASAALPTVADVEAVVDVAPTVADVEAIVSDEAGLPDPREPGGVLPVSVSPEPTLTPAVPPDDSGRVLDRIAEKVATGQQVGSPDARAALDEQRRVDRVREAAADVPIETAPVVTVEDVAEAGPMVDLEVAREAVDVAPTEAQKEAGNYKKGHLTLHGLDITIENPVGTERAGTSSGGTPWRVTMPGDYGYVKRTEGADGDHVDVYIGPDPDSTRVFVIDQVDPESGAFDEHKAILGTSSEADARSLYVKGFSDGRGRDRIGGITEMPVEAFKSWAMEGDTSRPLATAEQAPAATSPESSPQPPTGRQQPTVSFNQERQSVEVVFPSRPDPEVLAQLKAAGFRWAKTTKRWYKRELRDGEGLERRTRELLGLPTPAAQKATTPTVGDTEPVTLVATSLQTGKTDEVTLPAKTPKPVTPQVPAIPGTKVVLPPFATAQYGKTSTDTAPAPSVDLPAAQPERNVDREGATDGRPPEPARVQDSGALASAPADDVPATRSEPGPRGPARAGVREAPVRQPDRAGAAAESGTGDPDGDVGAPGRRGRTGPVARADRPSGAVGLDFRIPADTDIGSGGPAKKLADNIAAIKLLKQIEAESRKATTEEQVILARYVGWGGLSAAFNSWTSEGRKLREAGDLMTPEETQAAKRSTTNAHYTSVPVIRAMWRGVQRLGFSRGRVLEPSMGVGHFFGAMPSEVAASTSWAGVELDSITGRIAQQLYQNAAIQVTGFERAKFPDDFFDLAISNVPFGNYPVVDNGYRSRPRALTAAIHNYFFAKGLDRVRPGGLVAFITSRYTMDAKDRTVRAYLAERADLVGAIRLPRQAFKGNAGTEVVTDIVFLRKRAEGDPPGDRRWIETAPLDVGGHAVPVSRYFVDHPEMIVGTPSLEGSMYSDRELTVDYTGDLEAAIDERIQQLPERVMAPATTKAATPTAAELVPAPEHVKPYAFAEKDGKLFVRIGDDLVSQESLPAATKQRIRGMMGVRDALRSAMRTMLDRAATDKDVKAAQRELGKRYDAYVKQFGYLSDRGNVQALDDDPDLPLLLSLEQWDPESKTATKAAIFTKRTLSPRVAVTSAESPQAALLVSLNETGRVDWTRMSTLTGQSSAELQKGLRGLVYQTPSGAWQTADEYLSGDVRTKLQEAKTAAALDAAFDDNVRALEAVQPEDLLPTEIEVRLGADWIPAADVTAFVAHITDSDSFEARYLPPLAQWVIEERNSYGRATAASSARWGTGRYSAVDLIDDALNLKTPSVYDPGPDDTRVLNVAETTAAREKQQAIRDEFTRWLWADEARATRLARLYNDTRNNLRLREYDGSHLELPGMAAGETLRPHQKNAIWRQLQAGNTLLAHVVGAGKTWEIVGAAMEMRRLGMARKPLIVVPNHLTEQWGAEFLRLYPTANVLVATKKDFESSNRKRLMSRIATGDWDAVIVGHSSYGKVPVSDEVFVEFLQEQVDILESYLLEMPATEGRGKRKPKSVKEIEKAKARLEAKIQERLNREDKDDTVTFEELGVDALFVDEAHLFKNLWFPTKMTRVAGLPNSESNRSFDMFLKTRHITRQNNGRGVVFATGTPIANSMSEMFTMQRYLAMAQLKASGLGHFDAWAQSFGDVRTSWELAPEGSGYRQRTRFARFVNLPELLKMFRTFADVKTASDLNLPTPKIKGGKPGTVAVEGSKSLKAVMGALVKRAEAIRSGEVDPSEDNMLKITSEGRKAALDLRLLDPGYGFDPNGKVAAAVDRIAAIYHENTRRLGTQLVFSDLGVPKEKTGKKVASSDDPDAAVLAQLAALNETHVNLYEDIKQRLVAKGIPAHEIAFIHDANTDAKKLDLFTKVNAGKVRVLLGSTEKMGAGMNVQQKLVALHHLDVPWRPADVEQREGRIIRQGNEFYAENPSGFKVEINRYVTKGSFDAYMWQTVETKAGFIAQAMSGNVTARSAEDVDAGALNAAEVKAIASGNPKILEKVKIDSEIRRLEALRSAHESGQWRLKSDIRTREHRIAFGQRQIASAKAALAARRVPDEFEITIGGQVFTERAEAQPALEAAIRSRAGSISDEPAEIGAFAGLPIAVVSGDGRNAYREPSLVVLVPEADPLGVNAHLVGSVEFAVKQRPDALLAGATADVATQQEILEGLQREVGKSFADDQRLAGLRTQQQALEQALNLDRKSQEAEAAAEAGGEDGEGVGPTPSSGGGSEAMAGRFTTTIPPTSASVRSIRPIEFPELVDLARELVGTPQVVKRFRNEGVSGRFTHTDGPGGTGTIRLAARLFQRTEPLTPETPVGARVIETRTQGRFVVVEPGVLKAESGGRAFDVGTAYDRYRVDVAAERMQQLAATLAHEIGHLVDWLPDYTLKRGNILGRLFTLRNFLRHTFTASDGQTVHRKDVQAELLSLSKKWRPWDEDAVSANFNRYRRSSKELYADALSALLNNPGLVESEAPIFFRLFFEELDAKPPVKQAYFGLQEVLAGTPEELIKRRREGVRGMFAEGDMKAMDLERLRQAEQEAARRSWWQRFRIQHVDKNAAVRDLVDDARRRGAMIRPDDDPRYLLEERNYLGGKLKAFAERYVEPLYRTLTEGGVGWATFGEALFYERVIAGDRSEVANPRGITPDVAESLYRDLKAGLDPEQVRELSDAVAQFREMVQMVAERAYEAGLYSDDLYAQMRANPAYAGYRVIEHLERDVTSTVYRQIGTLKDITNPADATILKALVTLKAVEHQRVKLSVFGFLEQAFPEEIQQADERWSGRGRTPVESRDKKKVLVLYKEKGRLRGKYVSESIATSLNNESVGSTWATVQALRWANNIFRPAFTTLNLGFQTGNFVRDLLRFWKNQPDMTLGRALRRYRQAVPLARVRAFGLPKDPTPAHLQAKEHLIAAEESGLLSVTYNDIISGREIEDTQVEDVLSKLDVGGFHRPAASRYRVLTALRAVTQFVRQAGDFIETLPKAAGIYEYMGEGLIGDIPADKRSFIRRKVGSPDFLMGGTYKPVTNEVFLFSNAIAQAIRADIEVATDPETRSAFWWKTATVNIAPKLALFAGAYLVASGGGDDDESAEAAVARALKGITEYDMTNYLPLPLWVDENGQTVYLRIPQDDAGRLIGGLTWKMLRMAAGDQDTVSSALQVFDYMAGQAPTVSPAIAAASDVVAAASGRNVYDSFRGRMLFTDDELKAKDWHAARKFVGYEFQQLGGAAIWKFHAGQARPDRLTPGQKILELPMVSSIAGRWLRITDYGHTERLRRAAGEVGQAAAKRRLATRDAVNAAAQAYLDRPDAERTVATRQKVASEIVASLASQGVTVSLKDIQRRLNMAVSRGGGDATTDAVLGATSNTEKIAILQAAKESMGRAEFARWLLDAQRERIVSKDVAKAVR